MLNKFSTQMMRNQIFNVINDEYIEIPQKWMDTLENLMYRMLIQKIITSINIYTLRGGGSMCSSKAKSDQYKIINQLPNNFCQNIKHFTNVIVEKAMLFHDKFNQDEIICAFMWFHNNQEYLQSLCINQGSNLEHYDIVEITLDLLVKQLTIYLKLSGYLLHSLLQICNDLLRVIFYYQKMNPDRYMQVILKDKFLSQISELEEQIKIESNNIWVNGIDFELQMIKICLTHCRTNSQEGQKLAMNILSGIVTSISQLKPSQELIDSLVEAGKYLLLNFYDKQIKNPLQIYELYFFFQNLKWTILNQLKSGYSVQKTIMQFNDAYNQYIRKSQNWIVHYCWINLISELMSYRIIISKSQMKFLLDQFSGTQITLVSLFESNHITPIPYDKQQVKVKIFDNQNLNLKDFACLKLFQEYLINEQEKKIQLLPDYTNFEFDSSSKNPNNILDLYITLILNEDNIDLLLSLNCQIKKCKVQLKQNFEQITNQISLTFLKQNSQQDFKICLQDLQYLINQQKQQSLQLLYLFYEIDIARIKEILNLKAFEQIVKYYSLNQRNNKENIQIPNSDELEKECQMSFVQNLVKIPKLWIIISKILCMYSEDIFDMNIYQKLNKESISNILKDFEQLLLIVQDTDLYLDSFVIKIKKAKKGFQNIFISNNINSSFQEKTSQRDLWENIIKIYNSSLIKSLISEIHSYHTQNWKNNIWKFETLQDFENNLVKCIEIRDLFKGLKKLFRIHQSKLFLLQYENIVQKISSENDMQSENEKDDERIQEIKIQNLIFELKSQLKIFFEKYPKIDITKEELKELNGIEKAIQFNLLEIQQKNWSQERKLLCIMTFQKILNQISLLGLCKVDKQILKQDIFQLLDNYLQKSNSIDQSSIQINFENKKQQEFQHLHQSKNFKQQNYFDFEKVTSQLNEIIYKTKKIKQIIIQNRNYQIWITQVSDQLLKQIQQEDFQGNIKEIIFETLISIELFLSSIIEQEQFVFNKDKFTQASLNLNIDLIAANLILLNQNSILQDPQLNQMENVKCDKIYYQLLTNLENTSTIQKEWGFQDIFENSSYKVREVLVYNLIKMQAQVQESQIQTFCTNLIKKIWIYEKHPNVRNLLKNKELMEIQKKMFSHNLMTFQQRLKLEIQTMLKNIELLENSVLTENSPQMKNQLQQAIDEFEIYFDNITDMSQRLDINLIFLKEISKDLKSLKSSIDLVLKNLNGIVNDIRKLRGKNYFELFLIRKDYILKQKMQNEIDQVHIQLQTQEYDPISGSKLQNNSGGFTSYLLQYQYDNFVGEVNEFLWNKKERRKDVMLLKGKAGSGKSRASINIEELLWNFDQIEPKWIPIYISLPSVKDPQHNLIEQGLQSENYNFDGIQIRELKEAVIAESYDEMKLDCQRINLYTSNRLVKDLNIKESGQNVKIIITTRDEILTSIGYQTWFYGKSLDTLKEVELLPFSSEQSSEYLSLYSEISVKRTIKRFYEFLKQLKGQNFSYVQFKTLWCQLEEDIQQILLCNQNQQMLFSIQDAEKIIQKIQNVEFFNLFQPDLINSLIKDLIQLWSKHKFLQIINNINIGNLLNTPFMLEIIVYVLPKMSLQFSQASFMRDILKINYNILKKESLKSINLVTKYLQLKDTQQDSLKQNENFDCTKSNQKLKDFDNKEISELLKSLLEELENQNFFEQHSIAHQLELQNNQIISQNKKFNVKFDAQFIVGAFKMNQQTAFDFYNVFVDFYHAQQIQKWMDLGKAINYESFMIDLKDFSTNLAIDMSIRQLTQVNYQQKGKLILQQVIYNKNIHNSWEDCYFSENEQDSDYKGLLRKCMLICSKGNQFAFNHKSIQEFFVANYILNFLEKAIEIDFKINQEELLQSLFNKNDFNLSLDQYQGTLELLKPKLKLLSNIKQRLIEIINFQKIVQNSQQQIEFIRAPSNSFYLLSCLGEYLEEQNFSKLQISNTKLNGLSLFKCNLNNTIFDNVSIDSCNFSCSTIENANWTNLLCKEKPSLIGHNKNVVSLNFNTAGSSLITGSIDGMIKIWPIYQDQEPLSLSFENEQIYSLSYVETHNKIACLTNNELKILNSKDLSFFNHRKFYNYEYERINVSPDFNYIAVIQGVWKNQVLFILEMKNLTEIQNQGDIHQIQNSSLIQCIALSYDQKILAVGGQEISFWNVTNIINIQKIADLKIELKKKPLIKFSSNNELLATYDEDDNAIQFWRIKDLNNIVWLNSFGNSQPVAQMEFLENNKYFVIRTYQVIICDLLKLLEDQEAISQQFSINFKEIALSPNSQTLACIEETFKSSLKLFDIQDIQNIKQIGVLIENMEQLQLLRFSFDGIFLICCKSKEILIWNVSQQQLQNAIVVPQDKIIDIIISQDQKTLISCSLNQILIISDVFEMNYSNQFKIIDINFNCQGVNFWNNTIIAIFGQNNEASIIQIFDLQQQKILDQISKDEMVQNVYFINQYSMVTLGESCRIYNSYGDKINFKESKNFQIKGQYSKFYPNNKYLLIYDFDFIFIIDTDSLHFHKIKVQSKSKLYELSSNLKFLVSITTIGIEIKLIDKLIESKQIWKYQANDFSISSNQSLIALPLENSIIIRNLNFSDNVQAFYIRDEAQNDYDKNLQVCLQSKTKS
ncbi:unnamed protein product [Paramecium sonneborni]|uniref:Uncharacterized protein n=1 Tax=Paramecium sonneborni TaxID=65129 RepID=A0A8S1MTK8_9CILI|nr:unnamed protein product [Paramecium sonneborni]